jgi:glycosyltransferase involved in cell wall biosynthesis
MIVFTRFAAEVARLDRRGRPARAALDVIPMAGPPVHPRTAAERPTGRRIVSLGYTDEVKGVSLLTRALAELLRNHPDATLTFVGTVSPEDAARWSAAARELGIERSLRFTGFVSDERYWEELAQADLAVQLRTNGEGSAVVMDCLAAGVPTVVTDMGWSAELPAGSVVPVPLGVAPRALADVLGDVLADAERRTALSRAGLDYARQTGFPEVARRFVDVLGL